MIEALLIAALAAALCALGGRLRHQSPAATDVAAAALVIAPLLAKVLLLVVLKAGVAALPLHVCDVAGLLCFAAILWRDDRVATGAVYTALFLSSLAAVAPDMGPGPTLGEWTLFWVRHLMLLAGALYVLFVQRVWPTWRGFAVWTLLLLGYAAVATVINQRHGTNFGYLAASAADQQLLLHWLGPWPERWPWMVALPLAAGALATLLVQRRRVATA